MKLIEGIEWMGELMTDVQFDNCDRLIIVEKQRPMIPMS